MVNWGLGMGIGGSGKKEREMMLREGILGKRDGTEG